MMSDESDGRAAAGERAVSWRRAVVEILLIAAIFAAAGCWPVPDVNETVYLTKARHASDPAYGSGDFFLETPDAHGIFYLVIGPLAAAVSLETAAWIGRIAGWLALAVGFRHLARALTAGSGQRATLLRLAAAAIFSLALRQTTAAGEWVIGGCEAKVFAWALVLGGLGEFVGGRFAAAWLLMGGGTAFHPIVGGWAMIATVPAWLATRPRHTATARPRAALTAAGLLGGLALAAAGIVPALLLSSGAEPAIREQAARIYVAERLPHHLLPGAFPPGFIARHLLAILVWWLLDRLAPAAVARQRLTAFTLAALGISAAGLAIAAAEPWAAATVFGLLRYYWFRLGDVAVPLALAFSATAVLAEDAACRRLGRSPAVVRGIVAVMLLADLAAQSAHWPLPGRGLPPRADSKVEPAAWADACEWLRVHAPPNSPVLTPRGAASLTWRTGLPEVVAWKNSPQDAGSLVEWRRRMIDCFSADGSFRGMERSTAALGEKRLRTVADRYGASIAIVPLATPGLADLPFERLHANEGYVVLQLDPPAGPAERLAPAAGTPRATRPASPPSAE
jgi:hypothetical protein